MPSICPRRLATAELTRLVGLEEVRRTGREGFGHRQPPGEAEGELGAVDAVVAAVDQGHRDVDDREAERALAHRLAHAFLDRRDPLLRYGSAVDLLVKLEAFATGQRPNLDDHVAELAMTARLLLVAPLLGHVAPDRLAIANGRRTRLHLDPISAFQPVQHRAQMLLVHSAETHFVRVLVLLEHQRRVFLE
jgi:hypothetical protein